MKLRNGGMVTFPLCLLIRKLFLSCPVFINIKLIYQILQIDGGKGARLEGNSILKRNVLGLLEMAINESQWL